MIPENHNVIVIIITTTTTTTTLKNAGLNTTQRWVKYGQTQRLGCLDPTVGLQPRGLG